MSYVVVADADVVVAVLLLPGYRVCARPRASDADVGRKKERQRERERERERKSVAIGSSSFLSFLFSALLLLPKSLPLTYRFSSSVDTFHKNKSTRSPMVHTTRAVVHSATRRYTLVVHPHLTQPSLILFVFLLSLHFPRFILPHPSFSRVIVVVHPSILPNLTFSCHRLSIHIYILCNSLVFMSFSFRLDRLHVVIFSHTRRRTHGPSRP